MKNRLIIFDMDNTILQSRIDFGAMREMVYNMLEEHGLAQYKRRSVAHTLLTYSESPDYDEKLAARMWREVARIEERGLQQAVLEPGAVEALSLLGNYAELAVLTNNTDLNLADNLGALGILPYVSCVAGRDSVPKLKPAPDGLQYIMARYTGIDAKATLVIGDAAIDALAAAAAGCGFIAYNRSRIEQWDTLGLQPLLRITEWNEQACRNILGLWEQ